MKYIMTKEASTKFTLLALMLSMVYINACGQMTYDEKLNSLYKNTVPLIDSKQLQEQQGVVILDTRSAKEYAVSHIKGASFLDYDQFKPKDVAHIDKDAKVVVYCSVGYRSERIGEKLLKMGFTDVQNLYGGIFDWVNNGHAVYGHTDAPTDSVHTYNEDWGQWLKKGIKVYE